MFRVQWTYKTGESKTKTFESYTDAMHLVAVLVRSDALRATVNDVPMTRGPTDLGEEVRWIGGHGVVVALTPLRCTVVSPGLVTVLYRNEVAAAGETPREVTESKVGVV